LASFRYNGTMTRVNGEPSLKALQWQRLYIGIGSGAILAFSLGFLVLALSSNLLCAIDSIPKSISRLFCQSHPVSQKTIALLPLPETIVQYKGTAEDIANSKPNVRFDTEKFSDVLVA